jgi:hypothetical protein
MSTAITTSHIQRKSILLPQTVVATDKSTGSEWLFQEITRRLPGRGLRDLDVATLTKLLREAERIMANTNLLLQSTTDRVGTPPTLSRIRTARCPTAHPRVCHQINQMRVAAK